MSDNKIREMIKQEIEAAANDKQVKRLAESAPPPPKVNKLILMKEIMDYAMRYRKAVMMHKATPQTKQDYISWQIKHLKILSECDLTPTEKSFVRKGLRKLENVKR
jgi:hypothetical protein